jgi:sugar phosphate isomerase/epimerase
MLRSQIAVQLWSVNDQVKDSAALTATVKKLKAIGYAAVELFGFNIPEEEVVKICKGEGMGICSSHENGGNIVNETQKVIDRCGKLGIRFAGYPFPHALPTNEDEAVRFVASLDKAGEKLRAAGITLCYHNHAHEFRKFGGRTLFERIFADSDPRNVQGEPDVFWVAAGGHSPVDWCNRLFGRLPLVHLKEYRINDKSERETAELGSGTLDFPAIVSAADRSGCKWFIVEQEQFTNIPDKFEALKASYNYLTSTIAIR